MEKHKLYVFDGCMSMEFHIDGDDVVRYTDSEDASETIEVHPKLKEILIKYVNEIANENELQDMFMHMVMEHGEHTDLGQCEQCGDWNSEYNMEIEL